MRFYKENKPKTIILMAFIKKLKNERKSVRKEKRIIWFIKITKKRFRKI